MSKAFSKNWEVGTMLERGRGKDCCGEIFREAWEVRDPLAEYSSTYTFDFFFFST